MLAGGLPWRGRHWFGGRGTQALDCRRALAVLFLLTSVEQSHSLLRSALDSFSGGEKPASGRRLRVVSINCDVGSRTALDEAGRFEPDIVLLQESPGEQAVREVATSIFGSGASVVWSPDCSIAARGELRPVAGKERHFVEAAWTMQDGRTIEVVCLRLSPPVGALRFLGPGLLDRSRRRPTKTACRSDRDRKRRSRTCRASGQS